MVTGDRAPIQARRARPMPGDECFPGSCYAIQQPRAHCETLATRCARTVRLITSQAQVTSGSTPQLSKVGVRRTQTGGSPKADSGAALGGGASLHEQMGAACHLSKTRLRFTVRRTTAGESLATSVPRHYPVLGIGHYPSPVQRTSPVTHGLAP